MTVSGPNRPAARYRSAYLVVLLVTLALGVSIATGVVAGIDEADNGPIAQTDNGTGTDGGSDLRICDRHPSTFVNVINDQNGSIPGFVRNRVRDSKVHLQVFGTAGGNYTVVTNEQSQVVSYSDGKPTSASVRVETDCETFRAITDSGDPSERFRTAYANDEVRFIGLTATSWMVFKGMEVVTDPISLAAVLFLLALLLVAVYVFYRRLSIHYRGGESAVDTEE